MSSNPLIHLQKYGQSVWLDQISRSLLTTGELKRLIDQDGLRGMTSNPTIFQKAIGKGDDYAEEIKQLVRSGGSVSDVYEAVVVKDIGAAADIFRPLYDSLGGGDGFVSLEVSPLLANDTQATIKEAKDLWARLNRPNVLIKVPATPAGLPAIEELIASGLNINVTLIFAVEVYEQVAQAYLRGLERRVAVGQPIDRIASVASFFVSRIDTAVDKQLEKPASESDDSARKQKLESLMGKAAIANAKIAYESFQKIFSSDRGNRLVQKGAKVQRPLWASTSTKNPKYRDTLYVEELIGPDTVNTVPMDTLDDFRDHGLVKPTLQADIADAHRVFADLKEVGIDMKAVTQKLTEDGVASFAKSFNDLIEVIKGRTEELRRAA
ncbi:MAG: transaldolase [Candidatus Korobacteraceae bacterium]